jgi:hypothetical protein
MFVPSLSWYNHRFSCIHGAKEQHIAVCACNAIFYALKTINFQLREKGVFCRLPGDDPAEAADDVPARSLRGQRLGDPDGAQRPLPFI